MKLLFYRYGNICEPDLIEQFKNIGFTVDTIEVEIRNKKIGNDERLKLISDKLNKDTFMFVFSINFFPIISDACKIYNVKYVGWSVDSPVDELFSKSIFNECNRIFTFDKMQCNYLLENSVPNVFYLPLGTNVARWDNVISQIDATDVNKFSSDISFVGSLYTDKRLDDKLTNPSKFMTDYLESFSDYNNPTVKLYEIGKNIPDDILSEFMSSLPNMFYPNMLSITSMDKYCALNDILSFHLASIDRVNIINRLSEKFSVILYTRSDASVLSKNASLILKGGVNTLQEMPKVFNLSKINLNITIPSIETGIPLRCWDIMGCGGFLMSNYQEEFDDYLTPGEDYECYFSVEDLIEKCDFYLKHDDIRKNIALSGYNKVKKYHTYINRMPAIIKSLM